MEGGISAPFIRLPVATSLLMVGVLFVGLVAYPRLPVAPLPQVDFPTIQVNASLPGASPDTMASAVAQPLETQFAQIAGVSQMTSTSVVGSSSITIQFVLDRNIDAAANDVQAAINAAGGQLPKNLPSPPTYRKVNPADSPILLLGATSDTLPLTEVDDNVEHSDPPLFLREARQWMQRWLREDSTPLPLETNKPPKETAEDLACLSRIPADAVNSKIHDLFIPVAQTKDWKTLESWKDRRQGLIQELRDVISDAAHTARLRPAERRGGQAGGRGGVPQRLGADGRLGRITLVTDHAARRAIEHLVAEDPVAGGRHTGHQRGVTGPRHAGKRRAQPRRGDAARREGAEGGHLHGGVAEQRGRESVDADHHDRRFHAHTPGMGSGICAAGAGPTPGSATRTVVPSSCSLSI